MKLKFIKEVDAERRKKIYQEIIENSKADIDFYALTALSALIVTIGLIIDNSAVIIGAMLLAPLFWPITSIAMAVIRGDVHLFKKSVLNLTKAIIIAIGLVMLFSLLSPFRDQPGQEILTRSSPNLFHLIVAFFAGVAGAFAIVWPGLSSSLVGVLVATALMPPIGVLGYGLTALNPKIALGAFLLFATNLIAIVFAAMVVLLFFGFRPPRKKESQEFMVHEFWWSISLLLIVAIPLTYTLFKVVETNNQERAVKEVLINELNGFDESNIKSIEVEREHSTLNIQTTIQYGTIPNSEKLDEIDKILTYKLDSEVKLNIKMIPIIEINQ